MISIRKATEQDSAIILHFIRELAVYEKLEHQVEADEASIRKTLFTEHPVAHVLIAEWQGKPAGFALYFYNYSTFLAKPGLYLEDLFVEPAYRNRKIGKALLVQLAKIAVSENLGRYEWSVLDWNTPAIEFYRAMGAEPLDGWTVQRVTGKALVKLSEQS